MKLEYLLFNLTILFFSSLGVALYPGAKWPRVWLAIQAILPISAVFLVWDQAVTGIWWAFNPAYTLGWYVGKLPLEECLFFVVVPWSCLIIWENLQTRITGKGSLPVEPWVSGGGLVLAVYAAGQAWWYTFSVLLALVVLAVVSQATTQWLRHRVTWVFVGMVVCATVIFNGYLTARPIVIYTPDYLSQIKLSTIPVEDVFYGLVLIGGIVILYESGKHHHQ